MKKYPPPKKEFLMLPNSVFNMSLDVYAFKIYAYRQPAKLFRQRCFPAGTVPPVPVADRFDPKRILVGSFLLTGIGCGILLLFTQATSVLLLMASLGVLGFGLGGNGTIFMKVDLSGLTPQEAGAGSGIYGLFRDLAAPLGVAVFVPLFTNQITDRIAAGMAEPAAAVASVHFLAIAEILCVAVGIIAVLFLPKRTVKEI